MTSTIPVPADALPIAANGTSAAAHDPVMLRVYNDGHKGATAFFRNREFLSMVTAVLTDMCPHRPRVFFHACSVGAEPYSFALWCHHRRPELRPSIFATDIEPAFWEAARRGVYQESILAGMSAEERSWFEPDAPGFVRVPQAVREMVSFCPPQSLIDPLPNGPYDAVFAMNVLTYLSPEGQTTAIKRMADGTNCLLGVTAFHPDTIRSDIEAVGFTPVTARLREIHEAWGDRCVAKPAKPGSPEYSWQLPPFDTPVPDKEYRFCSIFVR